MTEQEAIKILSKDTSMEAVNELSCYGEFSKDYVVERIQEAMDMGAKALEKQVAVQDVLERLEDLRGKPTELVYDTILIGSIIEILKEGLK